jgi:hypothetical protein
MSDTTLLLERVNLNLTSCEGNLYVNGKWFCHTIEDAVRAKPGKWTSKLKIYGKTAIPYGRYQVLVTWSGRFKRMLTGVFGVPDFEGIRIHNGTSELSSAGCVIVSYQADAAGRKLFNNVAAMNDLCKLVEKAQKVGKVYLTIIDKPQTQSSHVKV